MCVSFLASALFSCSGIGEFSGGDSLVPGRSKEPETANQHVRRATKFYHEQRFDETVLELEAALKVLPELPANLESREQLLSMLRLAKAKVLLARYRERIKVVEADAIRRKQIPEYTITQSYGTVWQSFEGKQGNAVIGENVTKEAMYFIRAKSGLEITSENGAMIRSVDSSAFSFSGTRAIDLNEGSVLLHLPKGSTPFRVNGPLAGLTVRSKKASTALFSVTTSGGLKIISNERDMLIRSIAEDPEFELRPGELAFALPDPQGLSRKMNVELSTILLTSNLLNGFEEPVPFSRSLRLAAMIQARRIKGRFRAVVGDVKSGDDFEVKVIEDKGNNEDEEDAEPEQKGGIFRFFQGHGSRKQDQP